MVSIAIYNDPVMARLARAELEAHGIKVFLSNEALTSGHPAIVWASGGLELLVNEDQAVYARDILNINEFDSGK